jgi:hypothetical protein
LEIIIGQEKIHGWSAQGLNRNMKESVRILRFSFFSGKKVIIFYFEKTETEFGCVRGSAFERLRLRMLVESSVVDPDTAFHENPDPDPIRTGLLMTKN